MFKYLLELFNSFHQTKENYFQYRDYIKERGVWGFGSSVYDYYFMLEINEKDYPQYLKKAYYIQTHRKLNLKNPKTLSEKIQWLKIYDNNIPLKTELTDKVLVRNYVKKIIGEQYLKPVLQICNSFDEIDFEKLPNRFIVKCNHGCKWQFVVKDKEAYLKNKYIVLYTKKMIDGWMNQTFFGWSDFETQYKNIVPKIIIEPMLCSENNRQPYEIEILCFNSQPKIFKTYNNETETNSIYDENYNNIDLKFSYIDNQKYAYAKPNELLSSAVKLSKKLAKDFKLVRIDWFINDDKLYFNEMTFTPYSGYFYFPEKYEKWDYILGKMLNLKGN